MLIDKLAVEPRMFYVYSIFGRVDVNQAMYARLLCVEHFGKYV